MIVLSDHSQSQVEREIDLFKAFDGFGLEPPAPPRVRRDGEPPEIAVCPSSRSASVYVLDRERRAELIPRIERTALALEGVDLVMHLTDHPDGEGSIRGRRGELRFMPGGRSPTCAGSAGASRATSTCSTSATATASCASATYPDALGRVWSALRCRTSAEVLLSARPGYEFTDWGGDHHVGGGSHGSLHANDSLGALLWCGTGPDNAEARAAVVAARRRADGARALRRRPPREGGAPRARHSCWRSRRARPPRASARRRATTRRRPAGSWRRAT